jgi:hypothetical protein
LAAGEQLTLESDEPELGANVKISDTSSRQRDHPSVTPPSREPLEEPSAISPRREFRWRALGRGAMSLEGISQQFRNLLVRSSTTSSLVPPNLQRVRARNTRRMLHRCKGYMREEISLAADISRHAIISHATPNLREICIVCGEAVEETGIFDCYCGEDGARTGYPMSTGTHYSSR